MYITTFLVLHILKLVIRFFDVSVTILKVSNRSVSYGMWLSLGTKKYFLVHTTVNGYGVSGKALPMGAAFILGLWRTAIKRLLFFLFASTTMVEILVFLRS